MKKEYCDLCQIELSVPHDVDLGDGMKGKSTERVIISISVGSDESNMWNYSEDVFCPKCAVIWQFPKDAISQGREHKHD